MISDNEFRMLVLVTAILFRVVLIEIRDVVLWWGGVLLLTRFISAVIIVVYVFKYMVIS